MTRKKVNESLVKKAPKSDENLLDLLFQGLDWPKPANLDVEDIDLIPWTPEDLHLDKKSVAKLSRIQQLPTLKEGQPFGVFILTFEGGKFPVGAVRRVVKQLVRGKRTKKSAKSLWDLSDLIFFCQSKDGGGTLHVVSFKDTETIPVLKVISWSSNATPLEVEALANGNLADLRWPTGQAIEVDKWRQVWSDAFSHSLRQEIKDSDALASVMAEVARKIRNEVLETYEVEDSKGPFRSLHSSMIKTIRANLTETEFADMFAQTMVYGLLGARIAYPDEFSADSLSSTFKFENPFLDSLYNQFRRESDDLIELDEFGLLELVEMLKDIDIELVLSKFSAENRKDDPVVYFYEHFIDQYDPQLRKNLGIYYTPVEVVRTMVKCVDDLIRINWGLADGIIDATTWREFSNTRGCRIPENVNEDDRVVTMVDPATGTGTFLLEWVRRCVAKAEGKRDVLADAVRATSALEIELSSYAVAHMKTSLSLPKEIRGEILPNICLGDTLAPKHFGLNAKLLGDDPIAAEGIRTEALKFGSKHTVVIGNPPYLRDQAGNAGGGQRLGGMVRYEGDSTELGLMKDIVTMAMDVGRGRDVKNLYNLFVYFWRWALWKTVDNDPTSPAICAFITPSSWTTGPAFVGLRKRCVDEFENIFVVDLGGDNLGARKEPNIFGIQIPVAIVIASRGGAAGKREPCKVRYQKLLGTVDEKLSALSAVDVEDVSQWSLCDSVGGSPFVPGSSDGIWETYPLLSDLFPWQQSGAKFSRTWPIAPTAEILNERVDELMSVQKSARGKYLKESTDRKANLSYPDLLTREELTPLAAAKRDEIADPVRYLYRSFDRQWCIPDGRVGDRLSPTLWNSLSGEQVFLTTLMTKQISHGPALLAMSLVPDLDAFCGRGAKDVIPIFRDSGLVPNVNSKLMKQWSQLLGIELSQTALAAYALGLMGTEAYGDVFSVELEKIGPRLPLTLDVDLFQTAVTLGQRICWLHTFGERTLGGKFGKFAQDEELVWSKKPKLLPLRATDFLISSDGDLQIGGGVLHGVNPAVMDFSVSGMHVLRKWVGYRTSDGAGRAKSNGSPLDLIRPDKWHTSWTTELREVCFSLNGLLGLADEATKLLSSIVEGPLLGGAGVPRPQAHEVMAPKPTSRDSLF